MFKHWPIAILGLYIFLMLLLTASLLMAWNGSEKFVQMFKLPENEVASDGPKVEEKKATIDTKVRYAEDVKILPPLPEKKPKLIWVAKRKQATKPRPKRVKKAPKAKKVCYQTAVDKLFNTCFYKN